MKQFCDESYSKKEKVFGKSQLRSRLQMSSLVVGNYMSRGTPLSRRGPSPQQEYRYRTWQRSLFLVLQYVFVCKQ